MTAEPAAPLERATPSPLLGRPGAVEGDGADATVAAHYGDPMREQRTLAASVGLVDRSHRGVLAVPGDDRQSWLHSLTTQHLTGLPPMTGTELLVLSPHGHVERHAVVADDGATTWLVNSGWTGGAFGTGSRVKLRYTRAIVDAIHNGTLASAPKQVRLKFNEALEPAFSKIQLTGPQNKEIPVTGTAVDVGLVPQRSGVRVEVRDRSAVVPDTSVSPAAPTGDPAAPPHGLQIVASLAESWGVTRTADGKVVWAEITAPSTITHA